MKPDQPPPSGQFSVYKGQRKTGPSVTIVSPKTIIRPVIKCGTPFNWEESLYLA